VRNHRLLCLACGLLLLLPACRSNPEGARQPVIGKQGTEQAAVVERRSEVLARWARQGIRDAILLQIAGTDGLAPLPPGSVERLRQLQQAGDWQGFADYGRANLSAATWLSAAVRLGIVKEINWVTPYRLFDDLALAEPKLKKFLTTSSPLPAADVAAMKMEQGCLTGQAAGAILYVCSPRTLHKIDGPVLLFFDAGFSPIHYREYAQTNLASLKGLFDELSYRELRIQDAVAVSGVADGTAPLHSTYLADEFVEGLRKPELFKADLPPALWLLRDGVDDKLSAGDARLALEEAVKALQAHPDDRPLQLLKAEAERQTRSRKER